MIVARLTEFSRGVECPLGIFLLVVVDVVVHFYPWFKFYFPFFGDMLMLIMSLKQRR